MKIRAQILRTIALPMALAAGCISSGAQGYYDDDIYYDASKAKKEAQKTTKQRSQQSRAAQQPTQYYYDGAAYVPWNNVGDYQSADTYVATGTSTRDVDEYNRHTPAAASMAEQPDSITLEQFEEMSNTRNLARFHNSQVARDAYTDNYVDDPNYATVGPDLQPLYGSNTGYTGAGQSQSTVNINLYGGYNYPYYSTWYSDPWYWNRWGYSYYDPWWGYSPSWSLSWGPAWGPSWSWSWGYPSYGWAWGYPSYGWGWHHPGYDWGWHHPGHGGHYRPTYTSSGAIAPNRPSSGSSGGYRPGAGSISNNRGGSIYNSNGVRPGSGASQNNGATRPAVNSTSRPGYREPLGSPNIPSSATQSSGTRGRGTSNYYNGDSNIYRPSTTQQQSAPSYNQGNQSRPSSTPSYNSSGSRGRGGSWGGSSSGGGFSGGGASRSGGGFSGGGGGGHRGR